MKIAYMSPLHKDHPANGMKIHTETIFAALRTIENIDLSVWYPPELSENHNNSFSSTINELFVGVLSLCTPFHPQSIPCNWEKDILAWLYQKNPDLVIVYHDPYAGLIPRLNKEGFKIIADGDNFRTQVAKQAVCNSKNLHDFSKNLSRWANVKKQDSKMIPLASEIWTCSEIDAKHYQKVSKSRTPVYVIPNVINTDDYTPSGNEEFGSIGYFGDYGFPPNEMAAKHLIKVIFPEVKRRVRGAKLYLVGRNPSSRLINLGKQYDDIAITGTVDDTRPFLDRCSIISVPLEQGSGTRVKILEAWAMAKPIVTTPKGCEGLTGQDDIHFLIREIEDFPDAILSLVNDKNKARHLGKNGRTFVEEQYSLVHLREVLSNRLNKIKLMIKKNHLDISQ